MGHYCKVCGAPVYLGIRRFVFQMNEIGGMVPLIVAKLDTYSSTVYLSGVRQAPFGKRFGSLLQTTSHDDYQ